jgi:xanthine dehydrogenase YagS FAD-binding subunit
MVGDNAMHAIFDNEVCVAVHPSTLGAALLALDAVLDVRFPGKDSVQSLAMSQFFTFDHADATRENSLPHGALIEGVRIPVATRPVRQAYERASPRLLADWAAVEVCVSLEMNGNTVADSRVVLGAVGRVPRRATAVEQALNGKVLTAESAQAAAQHATDGAEALESNGYKLPLARNTTHAALLKVIS